MAPESGPGRGEGLMIRPLEHGDAALAVALSRLAPGASLWPEASYHLAPETGFRGWAALQDGGFVGFLIARCAAGEAEVLNLAVGPSFRRRGIATALLGAALADFREHSVRRVFLEVRASNEPAIRFYEVSGFTATGRRPTYYSNPPDDAIRMSLDLEA